MTSALRGREPWLLAFCLLVQWPFGARADSNLPDGLVLLFEPSAASLDQTAIRLSVERELGRSMATHGAYDAATLTVGVTARGEVEVRYSPERTRTTRSVPISETRDVPLLIAHLAGNMVRDQAGVMLEQLAPSVDAAPQPTPPATSAPAPSPTGPTRPGENALPGAGSIAENQPEYLRERWLTSVLIGASFGPTEGASITVAQSRRFRRFEFGLGVEAGAARVDAELYRARIDVEFAAAQEVRVTLAQLTVAVGVDLRVLGRDEAQLQIGCAAGYRSAGILAGSKLSGSNGDFAFAPRVTAVFKLRGRHGLLLRGSWYVTPRTHTISASEVQTLSGESADGMVTAEAFDMAVQAGYQVGF